MSKIKYDEVIIVSLIKCHLCHIVTFIQLKLTVRIKQFLCILIIDHDTDNYLLDVNKNHISAYCTIIAFQFSWIVGFLLIREDGNSWKCRFSVLGGTLNLKKSVFVQDVKFVFTGYTRIRRTLSHLEFSNSNDSIAVKKQSDFSNKQGHLPFFLFRVL